MFIFLDLVCVGVCSHTDGFHVSTISSPSLQDGGARGEDGGRNPPSLDTTGTQPGHNGDTTVPCVARVLLCVDRWGEDERSTPPLKDGKRKEKQKRVSGRLLSHHRHRDGAPQAVGWGVVGGWTGLFTLVSSSS